MAEDEIKIKRRHLPHWTTEGAIYFITFRTKQIVLTANEQKLVLTHIKQGNGVYYTLFATVVMPDHVHLILIPKKYDLSRVMKGIKGVGARFVNKHRGTSGSVWQNESFDRIIRDKNEFDEKMAYMLYNPCKKGLIDDPWNYHGWYCNFDI